MMEDTLKIKLDALIGFGKDQLYDILMLNNWWQARKFLFCAGCCWMMSLDPLVLHVIQCHQKISDDSGVLHLC